MNIKLPSKRDEKWRHSDLRLLDISTNQVTQKIEKDTSYYHDKSFYCIVIVNGHFLQKQSFLPEEGIEISCINSSIDNYDKELKFEKKYQVLQNLEMTHGMITINVTQVIDKPIKLVKLTSLNSVFFTTFIQVKKKCHVILYEDFIKSQDDQASINNVTRIKLDDDASCKHIIQKTFKREVSFINTLEIVCKSYALYDNYAVSTTDKSYRFESEAHLDAKGARVNFYGVSIGNNNQLYDVVIEIKHNASNTFSNQHYNQVLNNNSSGSFYSNVHISKCLRAVEAHQLNKNLLIDNRSVAYSTPMLSIDSDDVICSHGSTTGNIDKESLNYLVSRGIKYEYAKELIILGLLRSVFIDSGLDDLEIENIYLQIASRVFCDE